VDCWDWKQRRRCLIWRGKLSFLPVADSDRCQTQLQHRHRSNHYSLLLSPLPPARPRWRENRPQQNPFPRRGGSDKLLSNWSTRDHNLYDHCRTRHSHRADHFSLRRPRTLHRSNHRRRSSHLCDRYQPEG
jgi:hypothetical protein